MLERIAIGFLTSTLLAYLGVIGNRYFIQKQTPDWILAFLVFVLLLRFKIGLDDIHYFAARQRRSKPADAAISLTMAAYVLWFLLPFQIVHDLRTGLLVNAVTILLSTASVALTAMDLDAQLKEACSHSPATAATKYAEIQRFYDEQPIWIINNCMYEAGLLILVYLDPASHIATGIIFGLLILLVIRDAYNSGAIGYISGSRSIGAAIHCTKCKLFLGTTSGAHSFCPTCGTPAIAPSKEDSSPALSAHDVSEDEQERAHVSSADGLLADARLPNPAT